MKPLLEKYTQTITYQRLILILSVIFGADTSIDGVTAGFALRLSNELNSIGKKAEVYVHGYSLLFMLIENLTQVLVYPTWLASRS